MSWYDITVAMTALDCSQPSIFSHFYSMIERTEGIARELDASTKRKTWPGRGWELRSQTPGHPTPACNRKAVNSLWRPAHLLVGAFRFFFRTFFSIFYFYFFPYFRSFYFMLSLNCVTLLLLHLTKIPCILMWFPWKCQTFKTKRKKTGHYRNVRGLEKSMVVFRLFEKLRYSNERSTIC